MTTPIEIIVEFSGADDAQDKVERITRGLDSFEKKMGEASGKTAAAADAVARFADITGNRALRAAAQFTSELARNVQAGAELGRMFGPGGAVAGGIIGGTLPALERLMRATDEATERASRLADEYVRVAEEAQRAMERARQQADVGAGVFGSDTSDEDLFRLQRERMAAIVGIERDIARLRASARRDRITEDSTTIPELTREVETARRELAGIQAEIDRRGQRAASEQAERDTSATAGLQAEVDSERRDAIAAQEDAYARLMEAYERYNEAVRRGHEQFIEQSEQEKRALEDIGDIYRAEEERKREAALETARLQAEAEEQAIRERHEQTQRANRDLIEANRREQELHDRQVQSYQEVTGVIVGGLTDALQAIISGEESAEVAFQKMLASFLAYIAEQASLKAIFEGAEAIAAFATGSYDKGALHLLAAGAYVGVAVAAGAGAAALSSSANAASAKQSEPERGRSSRDQGNGGDTTIVVQWNGPVVTAQTKADLGRELSSMVRAGQSRYA